MQRPDPQDTLKPVCCIFPLLYAYALTPQNMLLPCGAAAWMYDSLHIHVVQTHSVPFMHVDHDVASMQGLLHCRHPVSVRQHA